MQDSVESAQLWAQLKAAEHRLEELVAQHHIATLPIDPLRPNPLLAPLPPLDPFPIHGAGTDAVDTPMEVPCTLSTVMPTAGGGQRIVLVDFPKTPSVLQLIGAIRIAMANGEIPSQAMVRCFRQLRTGRVSELENNNNNNNKRSE